MYYIGIDPGKDGALAILSGEPCAVPQITLFDEKEVVAALEAIKIYSAIACLEHVGAMPGQGSVSMFSFGENFGFWQGVLTAYHIPFELVRPQKWKKEFSVTGDKNTSIAVCERLFPRLSLRAKPKSKKPHDGAAEAALMALYAKRRMGGGDE